jgi:hypothetical protein
VFRQALHKVGQTAMTAAFCLSQFRDSSGGRSSE